MNNRPLISFLLLSLSGIHVLVAQDDPAADGWTTEVISNAVNDLLNEMGQSIVRVSSGRHQSPDQQLQIATSFVAFLPETDTVRRVFKSQHFDVRRSLDHARKINSYLVFLKSIADTSKPIATYKFKVVGIERRAGEVITRVKVAFHGKHESGMLEQNQEWEVDWKITADDLNSLRLSQIRIISLEEVRLATSHQGPLFVDDTRQVFGESKSFWHQLAFGQSYWLRRIEGVHGMLNPAQNGMSIGDINGDGFDELYICQPGGLPNRMYFREPTGQLRDISKSSGTDLLDNSHASLWIDFDNDGDQDLVVSTASAILFFEQFSPLRFHMKIVLDEMRDCYSLAAADFDSDGDLDVYACGYFPTGADVQSLPVPVPYFDARNGGSNYLIRNEGHWNVRDATDDVQLHVNNDRFSYAALWIDYDRDGDQDLYVANDFGRDNLFENRREKLGIRFVDVSESVGLNQGAFGMSVSAADLNRDGFDDLYVANMYSSAGNRITSQADFRPQANDGMRDRFRQLAAGNSLLMNRSSQRFENVAKVANVEMGRWSWGANFVDLNNDGLDDLLVTNGYITGQDPDDL